MSLTSFQDDIHIEVKTIELKYGYLHTATLFLEYIFIKCQKLN